MTFTIFLTNYLTLGVSLMCVFIVRVFPISVFSILSHFRTHIYLWHTLMLLTLYLFLMAITFFDNLVTKFFFFNFVFLCVCVEVWKYFLADLWYMYVRIFPCNSHNTKLISANRPYRIDGYRRSLFDFPLCSACVFVLPSFFFIFYIQLLISILENVSEKVYRIICFTSFFFWKLYLFCLIFSSIFVSLCFRIKIDFITILHTLLYAICLSCYDRMGTSSKVLLTS